MALEQPPNQYLDIPNIRVTDTHIYFLGGILSNWYLSPKAFIGTRALDLCISQLNALKIPYPSENAASTKIMRDFRFARGEQWMMAMKAWVFDGASDFIIDSSDPGIFKRLQNEVLSANGPATSDTQRRQLWESALCQILRTKSPKSQKMLGRKVRNFKEEVWTEASGPIVVAGCVARAELDPELKGLYLATNGRRFVEGSCSDYVWAVGLDWMSDDILDESNWLGTNKLGESHDAAAKIMRER